MNTGGRGLDRRTVLVTGASGFLGRHVCFELRRRGMAVRALVRRAEVALVASDQAGETLPAPVVHTLPPLIVDEVMVGDLSQPDALVAAVRGAGAVVHMAARVHVMRESHPDPLAAFGAVNVDGARAMAVAAREARVRRFILISTVKAVDAAGGEPDPARDPYGWSKLEGEREVRRSLSPDSRPVVLRLPLVYGPGMKGNMLTLFRWMRRGVPLPLASVRNRRSLLFVGNLAGAVARLLELDDPSWAVAAGVHYSTDGNDQSTPALLRRVASAMNVKSRLVPLHPAFLKVAGVAADRLPWPGGFPFGSAAVGRLTDDLTVDPTSLHNLVGPPPFTVDDGLAATARWFLDHEARA